MREQLSRITKFDRCTLNSIALTRLERPTPPVLRRLKQLGVLRYRDSRGGLNKFRRVWDTNKGVHLDNIITLPQAIQTLNIDMNKSYIKVSDPKHRHLSKIKQVEPMPTKAQMYLSVCSLNPRSVKNKTLSICDYIQSNDFDWLQ